MVLTRYEILSGIGGAMVGALIIYFIAKARLRNRLPPGSVVVEGPNPQERGPPAGTPFSRRATRIGMGFGSFFTIFALIMSISDLWPYVPACFIVDFPPELNWGGMVAFWLQYTWGLFVTIYNVNYTPLNLGMKGKYVMATGGPYKWVRHPMYVEKALQTICIFFVTGLWPALLGVPFWFALPAQAKGEEEAMRKMFGAKYDAYCKITGRFFPKVRRLPLKLQSRRA